MKYLKFFENIDPFNDWDWDETQPKKPHKEYHGILIDDTGDMEHYKFIFQSDKIKPGDWVVHVGDGEFGLYGPVIQKVYGEYDEDVSLCADGYDDVESDYRVSKEELSKIKITQ